jgi:hypothetical protein
VIFRNKVFGGISLEKKVNILVLFLFVMFVSYSQQSDSNDVTSDLAVVSEATNDIVVDTTQEDTFYVSTLSEEDDPFAHYNPRLFWKSNGYQKTLVCNRIPFFFIDELDVRNLTLNTNVSLRTPYTQIPFGGLSAVFNGSRHGARGLDFGFYYRDEHLLDGRVMLSALNSFAFNGSFYTLVGVDVFPGSEERKLKLMANMAVYTTAPQYGLMSERNSKIGGMLAKITDKLGLDFSTVNKTGFHFMFGGEYELPFDIYALGALKFNYNHIASRLVDEFGKDYPAKSESLNEDFLSLGLVVKATRDTRKQEKALRTGNLLTGSFSLDLPLVESDYYKNQAFIPQFSINATDVYCKKVYKDYAIQARAFVGYNYGYLTNLSGDGAVRGLSLGSFSGFGYALANIEASIPVMYIDLHDTANYTHRQKVTYLMYLNLFVDGGIAFSNDEMKVRDYEYLSKNTYLKDFRCYVDDKNYLTYALSAGGGITFVPYFLHFTVRIDVGVNILEAALEQKAPSIGLTVSFNDMF